MRVFTIKIHMDNGMRTLHDVARALREISRALQDGKDSGPVRDMEQHTVGVYAVKEE
jgi:hypothetical protein